MENAPQRMTLKVINSFSRYPSRSRGGVWRRFGMTILDDMVRRFQVGDVFKVVRAKEALPLGDVVYLAFDKYTAFPLGEIQDLIDGGVVERIAD